MNTVCLCGSTQFIENYERANIELTKRGLSVITISMAMPKNVQQTDDEAALKEILDLVHFNKILRADSIFVVGPGYIGKSTAREIIWAEMHGKPAVAENDCTTWDEAAHRLRHGVVETYIYPKAREALLNAIQNG